MCLWEVSHYGCLQEVSHNGHNWQWLTHVTNFMKYMVHGWDTQYRELLVRLRPSCNLSFFINELQYFPCVDVSPLGFYHMKCWCYECCYSLCNKFNVSLKYNMIWYLLHILEDFAFPPRQQLFNFLNNDSL